MNIKKVLCVLSWVWFLVFLFNTSDYIIEIIDVANNTRNTFLDLMDWRTFLVLLTKTASMLTVAICLSKKEEK